MASPDPDPLMYSRVLIVEHARRAANYADMLRDLCEMRDDDGADVMRRRLIAEVNAMNAAFKALAAGRAALPVQDAAAYFRRNGAGRGGISEAAAALDQDDAPGGSPASVPEGAAA